MVTPENDPPASGPADEVDPRTLPPPRWEPSAPPPGHPPAAHTQPDRYAGPQPDRYAGPPASGGFTPPYGPPPQSHGQPVPPYGPPPQSHGQPVPPYGPPPQSHGQPISPYGSPPTSAYQTSAYPTSAYPTSAYPNSAYPNSAYPNSAYPTPVHPAPTPVYPPAVRPSAEPTSPAEYQHLLRTPRQRWWKPIATLGLFVAMVLVVSTFAGLVLIAVGAALGEDDPTALLERLADVANGGVGPASFLFLNFTLIILIPLSMWARWIVYGSRPRFLSSVTGGLRWRWQARCLLVTLPIWAVYIGISTVVSGTPESRPAHWGVLILLVLLTTPLQCAGEEYAFRGLILQTIGAYVRRPLLALVAGAVPAGAAFAAAHGSGDPYILATLAIFSTGAVIVTWRTGGLEGAIAMHTANNVLAMLVNITYGGWDTTFIGADTTGDLSGVLVELVVVGTAVAVISWQAKRAGITTVYTPAPDRTTDPSLPTDAATSGPAVTAGRV